MTTEISAAAAVALHWFLADQSATTLDAIQHGINLAVAEKDKEIRRLSVLLLESQPLNVRLDEQVRSKDKRITELEGTVEFSIGVIYSSSGELGMELISLQKQLSEAKETAQFKDREIERLKAEVSKWISECGSIEKHYTYDTEEDAEKMQELRSKLTEANAKLAEAEEKILDETRLKEIWIVKASNTADQLSSAQAEIERLKEQRNNAEKTLNDMNLEDTCVRCHDPKSLCQCEDSPK